MATQKQNLFTFTKFPQINFMQRQEGVATVLKNYILVPF